MWIFYVLSSSPAVILRFRPVLLCSSFLFTLVFHGVHVSWSIYSFMYWWMFEKSCHFNYSKQSYYEHSSINFSEAQVFPSYFFLIFFYFFGCIRSQLQYSGYLGHMEPFNMTCEILVSWPGIKPVSPALKGGYLTLDHQGSPRLLFKNEFNAVQVRLFPGQPGDCSCFNLSASSCVF